MIKSHTIKILIEHKDLVSDVLDRVTDVVTDAIENTEHTPDSPPEAPCTEWELVVTIDLKE